jgi:hypothetical protein
MGSCSQCDPPDASPTLLQPPYSDVIPQPLFDSDPPYSDAIPQPFV